MEITLKFAIVFVAGLVIGAVWGWGAGIMSMLAKREMKPGERKGCEEWE